MSAPGNPGMAALGPCHDVEVSDPTAVADLAERVGADLVVVGPEAPLVAGAVDELARREIPAFGPTAAAAHLEGSKAFAKEIMNAAGAPTAGHVATSDRDEAHAALERFGAPTWSRRTAWPRARACASARTWPRRRRRSTTPLVRKAFGDAGTHLVIEEFLDGPERSVFGVCDGTDVVLLCPAQDYKRALDGDQGLNTGGMGAFTPVPGFGLDDAAPLVDTVFRPVLKEMANRGTPFRGLLYAGLVDTADGPRLLEFNVRFGDPETQVILPRLASDLGDLLAASATGSVSDVDVTWHDDAFVTVVLASGGYPQSYDTGKQITGVDRAAAMDGVEVFHAGTSDSGDGTLVTAGGRVLNVVGRGATIADARERAYAAARPSTGGACTRAPTSRCWTDGEPRPRGRHATGRTVEVAP
jgi:phosphoribosylamine---glycine ligase